MSIHGSPKSLKSKLAKSAGLSCAEGGTKVWSEWMVGPRAKVLYVGQEEDEDELKRSMEMINAKEQFFYATDNFYYVTKDYQMVLETPDGLKHLEDMVQEIDPTILILDPWSELHGLDDAETHKQLGVIRKVRTIKPEMGIIVVHHDCKPGEFRTSGTAAAMRGSALRQVSDSIINVIKSERAGETKVRLSFECRYAGNVNNGIPFDLRYDELTDTFIRI